MPQSSLAATEPPSSFLNESRRFLIRALSRIWSKSVKKATTRAQMTSGHQGTADQIYLRWVLRILTHRPATDLDPPIAATHLRFRHSDLLNSCQQVLRALRGLSSATTRKAQFRVSQRRMRPANSARFLRMYNPADLLEVSAFFPPDRLVPSSAVHFVSAGGQTIGSKKMEKFDEEEAFL
jgi:hypothetical protein